MYVWLRKKPNLISFFRNDMSLMACLAPYPEDTHYSVAYPIEALVRWKGCVIVCVWNKSHVNRDWCIRSPISLSSTRSHDSSFSHRFRGQKNNLVLFLIKDLNRFFSLSQEIETQGSWLSDLKNSCLQHGRTTQQSRTVQLRQLYLCNFSALRMWLVIVSSWYRE